MEVEPFELSHKQGEQKSSATQPEATREFPKLSFVPEELLRKMEDEAPRGSHDRCALFGLILGAIAVVSWIVILFGVVYSIAGIVLSVIGLRSAHQKWAKVGLGLSVLGLMLSVLYVFAVYNGMINYNYFTSEFWGF